METGPEKKPAGLRWNGQRPLWRASKAAVAKGYPLKSVNLSRFAHDPDLLRSHCERLQAEMLQWLNGIPGPTTFDGSIKGLLAFYETDPDSPFHKLKRSSRQPYLSALKMMTLQVGQRRIGECDYRDVKRWFEKWMEPTTPNGPRKVARARLNIAVLRAAIRFGIGCRKAGCIEFGHVLNSMQFEAVPPRSYAPTADQVIAVRTAAREAGQGSAAFAYALQFEGAMRQWDVIGQWVPLSDPRPSSMIYRGQKWIGPTWSNIDDNLIFRYRPTKTERTTGQDVAVDLSLCPMVVEEIGLIPAERRVGPLIVDEKFGRPYSQYRFERIWRDAATQAELPAGLWNRDLRAGGTTEARAAAASIDDIKKVMGHSPTSRVTATVYDRAQLEAHRRVAAARRAHRQKT